MRRKAAATSRSSLVAKVTSAAKAVARKVRARKPPPQAKATRPSDSSTKSSKSSTAAPLRPVKRVSVVRKPARGPTVHASRGTAPKPSSKPRVSKSETIRSHAQRAQDFSAKAWTALTPPVPVSTGPVPGTERLPSIEEQFSIPTGYGDNHIVLLVKDPWWLYAYWEIQPSVERTAHSQLLPHEVAGLQTVLRVYDVTGVDFPAQQSLRVFDIPLSGLATSWYIHTNAPNSDFIVEIGIVTSTGRFILLARSNRVTTPRAGPSEILDEAWMTTDETFTKLVGGMAVGLGSSGWTHLLPQQLFSGGWSLPTLAGASRSPSVRGFWYRIEADLVIQGATEPRATLKVQGQPVLVRKDGTFSVRCALPEGAQAIELEVTSPDGRHSTTVTPIISLTWGKRGLPDEHLTEIRKPRVGE